MSDPSRGATPRPATTDRPTDPRARGLLAIGAMLLVVVAAACSSGGASSDGGWTSGPTLAPSSDALEATAAPSGSVPVGSTWQLLHSEKPCRIIHT